MTEPRGETDQSSLAEDLNLRAYLALSRVEANPVRHIVSLLRSGLPIDPAVRNALADALEGKKTRDILSLEFVGKEASVPGLSAERRHRFFRDLAIARDVALWRKPTGSLTRRAAQERAADKYKVSYATCDAAVETAKNMQRWVATHYQDEPAQWCRMSTEQKRHALEIEYFYLMDTGQLAAGRRIT